MPAGLLQSGGRDEGTPSRRFGRLGVVRKLNIDQALKSSVAPNTAPAKLVPSTDGIDWIGAVAAAAAACSPCLPAPVPLEPRTSGAAEPGPTAAASSGGGGHAGMHCSPAKKLKMDSAAARSMGGGCGVPRLGSPRATLAAAAYRDALGGGPTASGDTSMLAASGGTTLPTVALGDSETSAPSSDGADIGLTDKENSACNALASLGILAMQEVSNFLAKSSPQNR